MNIPAGQATDPNFDFLSQIVYWGIVGVGVIVSWVLASWKSSSEIQKLEAEKDKLESEMAKLAGDNLYRLQQARSSYDEAISQCSNAVNELVRLMRDQATLDSVRSQREAFCSAFSQQAVPKYLSYVEWEILDRRNDADQITKFATKHLLPELARIRAWLDIINLPVFTEAHGMKPLKIEERTVEPFLKIGMYLPRTGAEHLKTELESAVVAIC